VTHRFERLLTFPRATANAWERENAARHARVGERVGDAREWECVRDDAVDGVGAGAGAGGDEVERRGAARGRAAPASPWCIRVTSMMTPTHSMSSKSR